MPCRSGFDLAEPLRRGDELVALARRRSCRGTHRRDPRWRTWSGCTGWRSRPPAPGCRGGRSAAPVLSLHAGEVGGVEHEQRRRADERHRVLAGVDRAVGRVVGRELGVPRADLHLTAGEAAGGVDGLGPRLDAVDRALEQARGERRADVGHHLDGDVLVGDAGVGRLQRLGAVDRRCGGRRLAASVPPVVSAEPAAAVVAEAAAVVARQPRRGGVSLLELLSSRLHAAAVAMSTHDEHEPSKSSHPLSPFSAAPPHRRRMRDRTATDRTA